MIETIEDRIERALERQNHCLPAKIKKINEDGTVDVEIQIQHIYVDLNKYNEEYIDRPIYSNVRLFGHKSGDFTIYTPVKEGDCGMVLAFDRDCKLHFERNGDKAPPANFIFNNFNSSIFIPVDTFGNHVNEDNKKNIFIKYKDEDIIKIDGEKKVINYGETITIDLKEKKIKIESKLEWEGEMQIKGDIKVEGAVEVKGDVKVTGNITATDDVKAGSISLKNHTHSYTNYPMSPAGKNVSAPATTDKPS